MRKSKPGILIISLAIMSILVLGMITPALAAAGDASTIQISKVFFFDSNTLAAVGTITNNTDNKIVRLKNIKMDVYLDDQLVASNVFNFNVDIAPHTTRDIGFNFNLSRRSFDNWNVKWSPYWNDYE